MSEEVSATYRGMVIAVPEPDWQPFRQASPAGLARLLTHLVRGADVGYYRKNPCRPKKRKKPPQRRPGDKHVSTHRLLNPHLYPQKKKKKTG